MDQEKKNRKALRRSFTSIHDKLCKELNEQDPDRIEIQANFSILEQKIIEIKAVNEKIFQYLLEQDAADADLDAENITVDDYQRKYNKIEINVRAFLKTADRNTTQDEVMSTGSRASLNNRRKFKLPEIELKKFSGDIKDWLHFWGQFRKIDEDEELADEDKFQYLVQATIVGSRARDFVDSFPPTAENYKKVVQGLKARFGQEDMLIEVYVRDLLTLVLKRAVNKENQHLCNLYDKLESHLRALESLGVTSEKYAAMLFPLVESSLPEDLLRTWQRISAVQKENFDETEAGNHETYTTNKRLKKLMSFLRSEVQNEERIKLATKGFQINNEHREKKRKSPLNKENEVPSAASLVSVQNGKLGQTSNCIFCGKKHNSAECSKAKDWTLEERQKIINEKKCCYYCLKGNHFARKCKIFVRCPICDGRHVVLMCPDLTKWRTDVKPQTAANEGVTVDHVLTNSELKPEVFLQTLVVKMRKGSKTIAIRAIIDTGSQKSYVLEEAAHKLQCEYLGKELLVHSLFGGVQTAQTEHARYRIILSSIDDQYTCSMEALGQPTIVNEISHIKPGIWMHELKQAGIKLTDTGNIRGPIQLLIGADVAGKLFTGQKEQLNCGLVALETKLGWTVMGKVPGKGNEPITNTTISMLLNAAKIQDLWALDTLGIRDPVEIKGKHERDFEVQQWFLENVRRTEEGRYETKLPWISHKPELPTNCETAKRRLHTLLRKLKTEGNFGRYDEVLQDWQREGIIEEIPFTELGHYLPHRHVLKEEGTTKIRPVFDASSKTKNSPSLNDCLEIGPNLIELIPSVLGRFRTGKIGVIADIKRAFLQIGICVDDRDYLKFFWCDEQGSIKVYRHTRVVFGVTSSPFLLAGVINHHLDETLKDVSQKEIVPETVKRLGKSFYIDNCVTSVDNQQELESFVRESKAIMARACFDLRGWEFTSDANAKTNPMSLVLGLRWNRERDTLQINLNFLKPLHDQCITKRLILAIAHKLFDPLGFLSPVNVCPKLLLQQIWQSGIGWDTEVADDIKEKFSKWYQAIGLLAEVQIPRWIIGDSRPIKVSVHTFCDASCAAYATVIFVRVETETDVKIQLVQAKARVTPLKKITMPRLELMAATIGARLTAETMANLEWTGRVPVTYWSDSTTVLSWIKGNQKCDLFVKNRIQEIRQLTRCDEWHHINGENNPADLPSRGCSIPQFLKAQWWEGPSWLRAPPEEWPKSSWNGTTDSEPANPVSTILLAAKGVRDWYYRYYSNYQKIVRLVAWVIRFGNNCKARNARRCDKQLSIQEILDAERQIYKLIQDEYYDKETLKNLATLNIFKDKEGIIRVKTQVTLREDTESFRYPIILPDQHPVVRLMIMDKHKRMLHAGVQILLNSLREEFWITRGRRAIRKVINDCMRCKRFTVKNILPTPCPLPLDRVRDARVFEVTGVDYAGPLHLIGGKKAWIALFTCAVYRAVHIELVSSLSTTCFIQALRRFIARRGRPTTIYSDNGTNFVGTENLLSVVNWDIIQECATVRRIEWKFNPPTAAWWGGWWERLIRIIKDLLKRVLGRACLNYEEMLTLLSECEAIVNARPLTYMMDGDPSVASISPSMFLQEVSCVGVPDLNQMDARSMNKRLVHINNLRSHLRRRFRKEYLGCLMQKPNRSRSSKLCVGELVFIASDNKKRLNWPIAKIIKLIPGPDGECRLVKLKTETGELLRPVQRLHRLEISSDDPTIPTKLIKSGTTRQQISDESHDEKRGQKGGYVTRRGREVKTPLKYID